MTCPDCGTMTAVSKTERLVPDAPTRRLRTCRCGYRGLSLETWERRLPVIVQTGPKQVQTDLSSSEQVPPGENQRGESDPIRKSDPNPISSVLSGTRTRVKSKPRAESEKFAAFYAEYPRKKKRPRAYRMWVSEGCEEIADQVMAGLRRQLRELVSRPPDKVPHPATWLHDREWEDPAQATLQAIPRAIVDDRSSRAVDRKVAEYRDVQARKLTPEQLQEIQSKRSVG